MMDALKKEIQKAKKVEGTGLALLPSLVLLKRHLNEEGQALCDKAEKKFLEEAHLLSEVYEDAEKQMKDDVADLEDMKCKVTYGMSIFQDKILGLKNLKTELKNQYSG